MEAGDRKPRASEQIAIDGRPEWPYEEWTYNKNTAGSSSNDSASNAFGQCNVNDNNVKVGLECASQNHDDKY